MKATNSNANYLVSKIEVEAKLLTTMKSVENKLACYPGLSQTRKGSVLSYTLAADSRNCFFSIELGKNSMSVHIYALQSPLYFMHEALLRLLSIMQILSNEFEVTANKLLPYLVAVLARQQISHYARAMDEAGRGAMQQDNKTDILLARRISDLLKKVAGLRQIKASSDSKIKVLAAKLIILEYWRDASVSFISKETGLSKEEVTSTLSGLGEFGYRVAYKNSDRFELVRI